MTTTTNKPEVVAWRWCKPVVNDQGKTVGVTAWELGEAPGFLPWWTNEPLVRLTDYEALQAEQAVLLNLLERASEWVCPPDEGCRCDICREAKALTDAINNIIGKKVNDNQ